MGVNMTTIAYLRVLIIEIGSIIIFKGFFLHLEKCRPVSHDVELSQPKTNVKWKGFSGKETAEKKRWCKSGHSTEVFPRGISSCNLSVAGATVDGNPAITSWGWQFIPLFTGSYTSQVVVWDFFHQQYHPKKWLNVLSKLAYKKWWICQP